MRLEWGLGGANHIIAVRTLIVPAVLDVRFAGPDFVDGKVVPTVRQQLRLIA
jgi:hypothetical protein